MCNNTGFSNARAFFTLQEKGNVESARWETQLAIDFKAKIDTFQCLERISRFAFNL